MFQASGGDYFDTQNFPNHTTVLNLVHLWASCRQPVEKSQTLVRQLQAWYVETKRPDLKPTLKLYAALVRAQQVAGAAAADVTLVVQHVWQACHQQGFFTMDLVALNSMLHVLAGTRHVPAVDLVERIGQDLLRAFRQTKTFEYMPNQSKGGGTARTIAE